MKKYLFFTIIFILTGCGSKNILFEDIISISYQNNIIIENDYKSIAGLLSEIKFSCGKKQNYNDKTLTITDQNSIYHFFISHNYYMEFEKNNKYCYTKDNEQTKKLVNELDNIIAKYQNIDFFTLSNENDYNYNNEDIYVKLEKANQYIILSSQLPIYNFKINEIEYDNNTDSYKEINLLHSIDEIIPNRKVVIRKDILTETNFKISFETPYNYQVNIIPTLNNEQIVEFQTQINQK